MALQHSVDLDLPLRDIARAKDELDCIDRGVGGVLKAGELRVVNVGSRPWNIGGRTKNKSSVCSVARTVYNKLAPYTAVG